MSLHLFMRLRAPQPGLLWSAKISLHLLLHLLLWQLPWLHLHQHLCRYLHTHSWLHFRPLLWLHLHTHPWLHFHQLLCRQYTRIRGFSTCSSRGSISTIICAAISKMCLKYLPITPCLLKIYLSVAIIFPYDVVHVQMCLKYKYIVSSKSFLSLYSDVLLYCIYIK